MNNVFKLFALRACKSSPMNYPGKGNKPQALSLESAERYKKPNLDPNACLNYRPISNLSYLSKTLERLVSAQLVPYLEQSGLLPPTQSGFKGHHSTETLLLALLSDIYTAIDRSNLSLLALFDVSAAFDMVDH